jgi:hypothetical protein
MTKIGKLKRVKVRGRIGRLIPKRLKYGSKSKGEIKTEGEGQKSNY